MNSSKGYYTTITKKGHKYGRQTSGTAQAYRYLKKQARRAQRRNGHKEIPDQLQDWWSPCPSNMFSPIPTWLMSEWEKAGMEHFRLLRSRYGWFQGVRGWVEDAYQQRVLSHCDETLFEDLKRSVNQYAHMKSAKEEW